MSPASAMVFRGRGGGKGVDMSKTVAISWGCHNGRLRRQFAVRADRGRRTRIASPIGALTVNVSRIVSFLLLVFFLSAGRAGAASSPRYDLVYNWDPDIIRVLGGKRRLAAVLGPAIARQLEVVGHGGEYGVVCKVNATLKQALDRAGKQEVKLRPAGLPSPQPVSNSSYHKLYQVSYASGAQLEGLVTLYAQIKATLGPPTGDRLCIEKTGPALFTIVYRCWLNRAEAEKIASRHGALLKKKRIPAAVIPAGDRPVVTDQSVPLGGAKAAPAPELPPAVPLSALLRDKQARGKAELQARVAMPQGGRHQLRPDPAQGARISAGAPGLNTKMATFLKEQQAKGRIRREVRTALVAYDLTNESYLVNLNSHRSFQAASMIKPFVALAFFHQVDQGKLSYSPKNRQMMEDMIQQSSNSATNGFIRQVGGPARCEALLKKEFGRIVQQVRVKEYIPPDGRTYRNSAHPTDYIAFLRALWKHQLPHSEEMLRLMSLPGRDRIFYGTELPNGTRVYNKTGTTAQLCGDMGILVARSRDGRAVPYAIVGIVERASTPADYKQWMVAGGGVIRDFSSLVYEEMKQKYNLL